MLKNTEEKLSIKSISRGKRVFLTSGIVITSLCLGLANKTPKKIDDPFNNYANLFAESSKKIAGEKFDPLFEQFYKTGTVNINNKGYEIADI